MNEEKLIGISDKVVHYEVVRGNKPTKPRQIYEKPVRYISVYIALIIFLLFSFIGFFVFVGEIYFLFRDTKRPGRITTEQHIQTNKKEIESIREASQKLQTAINYFTNTKRGYDLIGRIDIKFRDNQIDPYLSHDGLKWLNPKKERLNNNETKK